MTKDFKSETFVYQIVDGLKLAIPLTLSYWLSLGMNWDVPQYSALAVILINLDTAKASLHKGVLRVLGTIIGVIVGFWMLAMFSQERLLMLVVQTFYLFFISYKMQDTRNIYFWYVSGFVPFIVFSKSYMNYDYAFYYGTFRLLETCFGILTYTFLRMLLSQWDEPNKAKNSPKPTSPQKESSQPFRFEKEKVLQPLASAISYIIACFIWIYTDPPGGISNLSILAVVALALIMTPINPGQFLLMITISIWLIVAPLYFLIMPSLDNGAEFLAMIFTFIFACGFLGHKSIFWKFAPPIMFVMTTGITNQQTYSFIQFVSIFMTFFLSSGVLIMVHLLFSPFMNSKKAVS